MQVLSRKSNGIRAMAVLTSAAVAICLLSMLGPQDASAAMIKKCPSAGSLKSAAGTSLKLANAAAGQDVFCHYTHALSATAQDSVSISVEPLTESDAAFLGAAKTFAKGLKAPLKKLSGIGDEAWEYTEPKSSIAGGGTPTSTVTILVGKREVTVIANIPAKNVVAVAKQVS
jgi:hypothetical protein